MIDITGQVFGRLTVLGRDGSTTDKQAMWLCECECGNTKSIRGRDLRVGSTKSCGCLFTEKLKERRTSHGMSSSRIYSIWSDMKRRCSDKSRPEYPNYGGRGISVCNEWQSFEKFKKDMYEDYLRHVSIYGEDNTSIDRVDVNGNYTPDNCRWATNEVQTRARRVRKNNKSGVTGVSILSNGMWEASLKVNGVKYTKRPLLTFEDACRSRAELEHEHWKEDK